MHRISARSIFLTVLAISFLLNIFLVARSWRGNTVSSVPDGDSIQLYDGRRVRLLGIDAPERDRCKANEARNTLEEASLGKHVRLKNTVKDSYGRILANVIIEEPRSQISYMRWWIGKVTGTNSTVPFPDLMLNRLMVARGMARYEHVSSPYSATLEAASTQAKDNKLGIYSSTCRSTSPPPGCLVKGNLREGVKSYYLPSCKYYGQVIVDLSYGDQWFCSESEALKDGYILASSCNSR